MEERLNKIAERLKAVSEKGGKTMWHMLLADTVLELLKKGETITDKQLRERLMERSENSEELVKDACIEAIVQLISRTGRLE